MDELETIRKSNTIFSTMKCPRCGSKTVFISGNTGIVCVCEKWPIECHYEKRISVDDLVVLLNHNGINSLIT